MFSVSFPLQMPPDLADRHHCLCWEVRNINQRALATELMFTVGVVSELISSSPGTVIHCCAADVENYAASSIEKIRKGKKFCYG